jgi:hypothetical protein
MQTTTNHCLFVINFREERKTMQNSSPKFLSSLSRAPAGLASALVIILLGTTAPRLAAQSDNFNSAPPLNPNWQLYALPYYGTPTFSYPPDDSGGTAFRIYAPPTGADPYGLGNARAGAFRADAQYNTRFSVGTDLLAWDAAWFQEAGLLICLQTPGLGTSGGYTATYSSAYRQLYISSITAEVPTTVAELGTGAITLDPTHRYRLVVSCHDALYGIFLFQLFDKTEPNSPWASAIGQDFTYLGAPGYCGLFTFEQHHPSTTEGADATFDNYVAAVPAAGAMPTTVTDLSPPPAGKAIEFYPTVTVGILDRDTAVDTNSILLCLDGGWIPHGSLTIDSQVHKPHNAAMKDFAGATVTYAIPTLFAWGSKHTNIVAFMDSASNWQTNIWTWTTAYPTLFASNSLPVGSLSARGFDARMVQSTNGGVELDNSLARALQQLAIPPQIAIDQTATSIVQVLNWDKTAAPPNNVPGLCPGGAINIAVESLAYLELSAGIHRFHINTDDRSGLYSGVSLADPNAQALWENPGSTANATFDFAVEAAGLYPFRCIWEETGGGAALHLWSTNFVTGGPEVLINDSGDPAGVVKAWYPLACKSSSSVAGPYTVDATAVNALNTTGIVGSDCAPTVVGSMVTSGTFTIPASSTAKFFRLDGPRATKITNISKVGSNVVISYQVR